MGEAFFSLIRENSCNLRLELKGSTRVKLCPCQYIAYNINGKFEQHQNERRDDRGCQAVDRRPLEGPYQRLGYGFDHFIQLQ